MANLIIEVPDIEIPRVRKAFLDEMQDKGYINPTNAELVGYVKNCLRYYLKKRVRQYERTTVRKEAEKTIIDINLPE